MNKKLKLNGKRQNNMSQLFQFKSANPATSIEYAGAGLFIYHKQYSTDKT